MFGKIIAAQVQITRGLKSYITITEPPEKGFRKTTLVYPQISNIRKTTATRLMQVAFPSEVHLTFSGKHQPKKSLIFVVGGFPEADLSGSPFNNDMIAAFLTVHWSCADQLVFNKDCQHENF